ncbi:MULTISPECIES: SDR family oxidoreductase [unclassified Oceanispirochaeta]|uniref:SDR family NAD(P)-dependent oxidoreductase n=1 Tax=unclassified Oceanispirochaeta TaxID=2635722 RepID=UPI000E08F78D|nr:MULTISPECIES: SDR family NAD(P)-dependent oxidoreductase [unclassified Oceanispirochaeta]MBF9017370.1 SDR family NAD(P)-dependent oxidoreductase [Oceanispirochaeta sp. M2]NPD73745.1 SDR family NAD(P)-dependent oxidoreductase [Oceanispirochaeta sp. M1]RDG30497.1 SDR family NAD(P)-dependent oxidoreductase [Oceanispirochaeta sp. M1]
MDSYVFISGAAGGLGRAYVHDAGKRGWDLFLTDIPGSPLKELAREIRSAYGVDVQYEEGSFLTHASRDDFFQKLAAREFKFNFLINVAGVEFETPFTSLSLDQIRLIMNVNMNGTVELTSSILEQRDMESPFRILTVSSLSYFYPMPYKAAYSSTKRFLYHFFTTIREELRRENVTVTLLCPAGMPTKQIVVDRIAAQGLMGRLTTKSPDYVAHHSIEMALKGKEEYIPGAVNRFLKLAGSLFSDPVRARMLKRRWDRAAG